MRAHLDIHGLNVRLTADHPLIFHALLKDLGAFRIPRRNGGKPIELKISALPPFLNGKSYPPALARYREHAVQTAEPGKLITRYMTTDLAVITHVRKRLVEAAVVPDPSLFPDPAYHYLFTQPLNLWFKRRGLFFLHAGCVAKNDRGVLLVGHPRAGKSTLTLAAVRAGFRFLSDEQPLLGLRRGRVWAHAFPRRIRLEPSSAARFPELRRFHNGTEKRVVFSLKKIWPDSLQSAAPVYALVFPRFKKQPGLRLRRIPPAEALSRLMQDDHFVWYRNKPLDRISKRHLDLFETLVRQAPGWTLEYSDRDLGKIPRRLEELLSAES